MVTICKHTCLHSTVFKLPLYHVVQPNVFNWCLAVDRLSNAAGCEGQMKLIFVFVASEVQYNVHVLALANKYPGSAFNCLSSIKYGTTCISYVHVITSAKAYPSFHKTNYRNFDSPSAPWPTPHLPRLRMMDDMLVYCRVAQICQYPYIQLGWVRLCDSKVSCPKTQHNDFNWNFLIRSPAHQPLGCHALHSFQTCCGKLFLCAFSY